MKKQNYSKENKTLAKSLEKEFKYVFEHELRVHKGGYKVLLILDLMIVWINVFADLIDIMHSILDDDAKFKEFFKKQGE